MTNGPVAALETAPPPGRAALIENAGLGGWLASFVSSVRGDAAHGLQACSAQQLSAKFPLPSPG
jgi:hypothetical protein